MKKLHIKETINKLTIENKPEIGNPQMNTSVHY